MKVRMVKLHAGPDGIYPVGRIVEVSPRQGRALIRAKAAVDVADDPLLRQERVAAERSEDAAAGTVQDVLARVDGDPELAQAALDAEQGKRKPRKGLVAELERIVGS